MSDPKKKKEMGDIVDVFQIDDNADILVLTKHLSRLLRQRISGSHGEERIIVDVKVAYVSVLSKGKRGKS